MLHLEPDLAKKLHAETINGVINKIAKYPSKTVRSVENRRTFKVTIYQKDYFVKHHSFLAYPKILKEVAKNFVNLKKPVLNAINEVDAINKLENIGVDTMKVSGYGINKRNFLQSNSFIITESLEPAISLEELDLMLKDLSKKESFVFKRNLIKKIAEITRKLHDNYLIHQDYYLCHFLYKEQEVFLIDLHRMQKVNKFFFKSKKLKELADLLYSSMTINSITKYDIYYFLKVYFNKTNLKNIFKNDLSKKYRKKISNRADSLYNKAMRKNIINKLT